MGHSSRKRMTTKFYAVVAGRKPGIYMDWNVAKKEIMGYSGAIYKSFKTRHEAETFMSQSTATPSNVKRPPPVVPLVDRTLIYTDGSHREGKSGFGVSILTTHGKKITAQGRVPILISSNNIAEIYAIYVAISLVQGNITLYTDSQYARSALTSYIHSWKSKGWSGVANRELIEAVYDKMQGRDIHIHHVDAHVGHLMNEEADRLANEGRLMESDLVIYEDGVRRENN